MMLRSFAPFDDFGHLCPEFAKQMGNVAGTSCKPGTGFAASQIRAKRRFLRRLEGLRSRSALADAFSQAAGGPDLPALS